LREHDTTEIFPPQGAILVGHFSIIQFEFWRPTSIPITTMPVALQIARISCILDLSGLRWISLCLRASRNRYLAGYARQTTSA